jgi:hypothetical protein
VYESVKIDGRVVVYYSCAETAKLIRQQLKEKFAGVKFSVRSDVYSGGASIRVKYDDENVAERDVKAVAKFFEGASFDGMIDLKSYHSVDYKGNETHWGADYVFVDNEAKWRVNRDDAEAWSKVIGKY